MSGLRRFVFFCFFELGPLDSIFQRVSLESARLEGHEGPVSSVAFAPGGLAVATASADETARLSLSLSLYIYIYICVCIYIYMYTYIYIYMYT